MMNKGMLQLAAAALATAALGGCAAVAERPAGVAASDAPARTALYDLFARSDAAVLERNPIEAFSRGDFRQADRLGNGFTPEYYAAERAAAQADLAALRQIDRTALNATDRIAYDVFAYSQQRAIAATEPETLRITSALPIDHFRGFHIFYPRLSSPGGIMPFATVADYDNALKRHAEVPALVKSAIARMREGMTSGIVQPKLTVEMMISQLDTQLKLPTAEMPYYSPVKAFPDAVGAADRTRLESAFKAAVEQKLRPTLQELRDFLAREYLPAARTGTALSDMPGGDAYYRFRIAEMTTLPLTADEVHALGLSEVARINADLAKARAEAGDRKPVFYRDKASLTAAWYEMAKKVDPKLDALFEKKPRTRLEIRPYEEYRERFNLAASYNPGNPDGSRPGIFYFSGYDLANRDVAPSYALYLHEGSPGHHFETMLAFENKELPAFLRFGGFTAFSEGWGLYAESLGYEMGLYDDPLDRIGALAGGELLRAVRLVVDTGLHAKGWSREKAIDYMVSNDVPRDFATSEVARYIVMPGQALAYKVGELKIKQLRAKAEKALGDRFDIKAFHTQILGTSDVPLSILEKKIDDWIAASR